MNEEIKKTLSPLEQQLCQRMDMIQVLGKCNRRVPILLTPDCQEAMKVLVDLRNSAGIPASNVFFFATVSENGHIDCWQTLHRLSKVAGCKQPGLITTTRLRQYVATVAQVLALQDGELKWLSNHLGHELSIHRDFYRLQKSQVEMAKVAKILIAIDRGEMANFKTLDDVNLSLDETTEDLEEDDDEDGDELHVTECDELDELPELSKEADAGLDSDRSDKLDLGAHDKSDDVHTDSQKQYRQPAVRTPWSELEISALSDAFSHLESYPNKEQIERYVRKSGSLRSTAQIRSKLQHMRNLHHRK